MRARMLVVMVAALVLVALGDWLNPICLLTPASDLRAR